MAVAAVAKVGALQEAKEQTADAKDNVSSQQHRPTHAQSCTADTHAVGWLGWVEPDGFSGRDSASSNVGNSISILGKCINN